MSRNVLIGIAAGLGTLCVGLMLGAMAGERQPASPSPTRDAQPAADTLRGELSALIGRDVVIHIRGDASGPPEQSYSSVPASIRKSEANFAARVEDIRGQWLIVRRQQWWMGNRSPQDFQTWVPLSSILAISREVPRNDGARP